jgi:hypothetical protein
MSGPYEKKANYCLLASLTENFHSAHSPNALNKKTSAYLREILDQNKKNVNKFSKHPRQ